MSCAITVDGTSSTGQTATSLRRRPSVARSVLSIGYRGMRGPAVSADMHRLRVRAAERYLDTYRTLRPEALADLPLWLSTIGQLLLAREPDTAFAEELTARWIDL
jgi:hypothetical protein